MRTSKTLVSWGSGAPAARRLPSFPPLQAADRRGGLRRAPLPSALPRRQRAGVVAGRQTRGRGGGEPFSRWLGGGRPVAAASVLGPPPFSLAVKHLNVAGAQRRFERRRPVGCRPRRRLVPSSPPAPSLPRPARREAAPESLADGSRQPGSARSVDRIAPAVR